MLTDKKMDNTVLHMAGDPMGAAIYDYHKTGKADFKERIAERKQKNKNVNLLVVQADKAGHFSFCNRADFQRVVKDGEAL